MSKKLIKLDSTGIQFVYKNLLSNPSQVVGTYLFNGYRIQISKFKQTGSERVRAIYNRRRDGGLCIMCGKKVIKINTKTGKLYRLCESHRKEIDVNRKYKGK